MIALGEVMRPYKSGYFRLNAYDEPVTPYGVTELRIHGVNGAPPESLLGDPHPILVSGDDAAAFYRRRPELGDTPTRNVEAYSWTGLNSRSATRALWLFLLPFGLVNFAGWLLPNDWEKRAPFVRAILRLLALTLTVHYVAWASVMAIDLLGWQCSRFAVCTRPSWLGWLATLRNWLGGPGAAAPKLVVVMALVPVLVIVGLWAAGVVSQRRYEGFDGRTQSGNASRVDSLRMTDRRFWSARGVVTWQSRLHAAAGVSTVGIVLAWIGRSDASEVGSADLLLRLNLVALVISAVMVVGAHWYETAASETAASMWCSRLLLLAASLLLLGTAWALWHGAVDDVTLQLVGPREVLQWALLVELVLVLTLMVMAHVLLGVAIALSGVGLYAAFARDVAWDAWSLLLLSVGLATVFLIGLHRKQPAGADDREHPVDESFWIFAGLGVLMLVAVYTARSSDFTNWWRGLVVCVPLVYILLAFRTQVRRGSDHPPAGRLRIAGPSVVAALGVSGLAFVSSAAIIFLADRLGNHVPVTPGRALESSSVRAIGYPAEIGWLAAAGLAALIIFLASIVVRVVALRWFRWTSEARQAIDRAYARQQPPAAGEPPKDEGRRKMAKRASWARLFASLTDDADWMLGAAVTALLAGSVVVAALGLFPGRLLDPQPDGTVPSADIVGIINFSSWALGALVLVSLWLVNAGRKDQGVRKTVGLFWEVTNFFPRRYHPWAPPCYAERSVPEFMDRVRDLTRRGSVVIIAHSEGTLISYAALLLLAREPSSPVKGGRVAWITYGCMIQRLFGRAFPLYVTRQDVCDLKERLDESAAERRGTVDRLRSQGVTVTGPAPVPQCHGWFNMVRYSDFLGGAVFQPLIRQPSMHNNWDQVCSVEERADEPVFADPTRAWRFAGQSQAPRLWRHSFDYTDDTEDPRFRSVVESVIEELADAFVGEGLATPRSPEPP